MLAGNMAGNPAGIGKRLGEIRGKLGPENVGNLNADQRANLQNEAGKLTQALKELLQIKAEELLIHWKKLKKLKRKEKLLRMQLKNTLLVE